MKLIASLTSRAFKRDLPLLTGAGASLEERRALVRKYLCYVEVELFSYCNRRCWFCPNSRLDRRSGQHFLPEAVYLSLLEELAELGFTGQISYSRYNEPLADKIILERLAQARKILPGAFLHSNSNGDFLDKDFLRELQAAGLNSLCVQNYDVEGKSREQLIAQMRATLQGLDVDWHKAKTKTTLTWTECLYREPDFLLSVRSRNFKKDGNSRGGLLQTLPQHDRSVPCFEPFNGLYIDYNGCVMPCCNLRSDAPEHADFILGTVPEKGLLDIYFGQPMAQLRRALLAGDPSLLPPACRQCTYRAYLRAPSTLQPSGEARATVQEYYHPFALAKMWLKSQGR